MTAPRRLPALLAVLAIPFIASACSQTMDLTDRVTSMVVPASWRGASYGARDKECLMRAMFFESNRSSRDGMIAVGTVVMNRLRSGQHGGTICEVVGARGQFAPGVMTRPMKSSALPDVEAAADAVLRGERNAKVRNAMYFHTAGRRYPYRNMHYVLMAGGNEFYERRGRRGEPVVLPDEKSSYRPVMIAAAQPVRAIARPAPVMAQPTPVAVQAVRPATIVSETTAIAQADNLPIDLPMALDGPTPTARPDAPPQIASAFPPMPPAPAQRSALPASAPFGAADGGGAVAMAEPLSTGSVASDARMSFDVDPDAASAIGAMLVGEDGSAPAYN